jgi:acetyl esterase/lipase
MLLGFQPFVLRYSTGVQFPAPMIQLAAAIAKIRQNAERWSISAIAICGFSAGGHLAAYYAASWRAAKWVEDLGLPQHLLRPDAVVLGYPVVDLSSLASGKVAIGSNEVNLPEAMLLATLGPDYERSIDAFRPDLFVTKDTPPMFIWHTAEDELVPARNSIQLAAALKANGVTHELHLFSGRVHGIALGDATTDEAGRFLNHEATPWPLLMADFLKRQQLP